LSGAMIAIATAPRNQGAQSMEVIVNGRGVELQAPATLLSLLEQLGHGERRVAVEVNREIVPRSQHASYQLGAGDRVELVQAMGGG
jgi:sulfur carrier protein